MPLTDRKKIKMDEQRLGPDMVSRACSIRGVASSISTKRTRLRGFDSATARNSENEQEFAVIAEVRKYIKNILKFLCSVNIIPRIEKFRISPARSFKRHQE